MESKCFHPSFDKHIVLHHKLTMLGGLNKFIFIRSLNFSLNYLCNYTSCISGNGYGDIPYS